ncbi:MAG TPA: cupin domain-containing protein [Fimbriimonadaceae bacterium]|nr:cupin domain-containing protein [Fimbriimonadaceae bacterium]
MFSYPHTIENGMGERLTFLRRTQTPEGEVLEVENCVQPGVGPPMHVHYFQEEALTVVQGNLGYQRKGEEAQFASVGDTVTFAPGEMHRFWNAGEDELRCTGYVKPPDSIEYFLRGIYEAQKKSGSLRPDMMEAAFLMSRYRNEFGMDEIPPFVQRFVFPVMVLIGGATGKYKKFADAPPPAR